MSKDITSYGLDIEGTYQIALWDTETGETIFHHDFIPQRIPQPYEKMAVQRYMGREDKRSFFNVKIEAWQKLKGIKNRALGYAIVLSTFMHYDNVVYTKKSSKIPVAPDELYLLLKISEATAKRVLAQLKENDLISEVSVTYGGKVYPAIKLNTAYFYRGSHSENGKTKTIKAFNETIQELFFEHGASSIAFIAKLMPYVDKVSNLIVFNPHRDIKYEPPEFLSISDISKVTGISARQATTHLRELRYGNSVAFTRINAGKRVMFKLNPDIATKTAGVTTDAVKAEFIARENEEEIAA